MLEVHFGKVGHFELVPQLVEVLGCVDSVDLSTSVFLDFVKLVFGVPSYHFVIGFVF